jgi:GNAT superfamily N-acetyltransferase
MDTHTAPAVEVEGRLRDGTPVLFRPVRPDDKERFRRGLELLSPQSRYRRFFRPIEAFTEDELRYLTEVDFEDHFAWLAVLPDVPGEPGIGVARWIRLRDEPTVAEAAVTVIDAYQNRGAGRMLLHLTARSAVERGVRAFRAWALGENRPILHLLRELGAIEGGWESGVLELTVPLPSDPEALDRTPAAQILRATAAGRLTVGARGENPARCCFEA